MVNMNECSVEGCDRTQQYLKRTWCNKHYEAWRRHGDPLSKAVRKKGQPRVINGPTKKCKTCGVVKDTKADFYVRHDTGWVYANCKKCHNKKTMAIYLKHKLNRPPKEKRVPQPCSFPNCRNNDKAGRILSKGAPKGRYCGAHHQQWAAKKELSPLRPHNKVFKNDEFRQCTACFIVKPVEEYHVRNDGVSPQSVCKKCAGILARFHLLRRNGRLEDALEKAQSLPDSLRQKYVDMALAAIAEAQNG